MPIGKLYFSRKYYMVIAENMVEDEGVYHTGYALQFQMLDRAIKENRKIAVYEADNLPYKWTEQILGTYGIEIDTYIEDVFCFYIEGYDADTYLFAVTIWTMRSVMMLWIAFVILVWRRNIFSFQGYRYLRTGGNKFALG